MSGMSGSEHSESGTLSSMHFWGVCCESGKQYAQVVGQRFRITMAALDPTSFQNDTSEKIVSLVVLRGGIEYLLCVLKHGEIHQVNLNLIFDKGENVKFYIKGHGKVYLSGYQLTDSECDVTNDENGYLCPLVEVKSKNRKSSMDSSRSPMNIEPQATTSGENRTKRRGRLPSWSLMLNTADDDDDDDESDEDYEIDEEESSSEEDIISEEDVISEDDVSSEENVSSDNEKASSDELDLMTSSNSKVSLKRKQQENNLPKKRTKNDSHNASTSTVENADDIICIEDNDYNDRSTSSFNVTPSGGSTPMPKKQINGSKTAFSEKKAKKEKKIKEILQNIKELNKKEIDAQSPTVATPSKQNKHPHIKLEGGVAIQDVFVGNGPVATKGKMLNVFFVGRLSDNRIFDARLPGDKPFNFRLGKNEVIKGWEVGLKGMKVGGRRKITVPPNMAYGAKGKEAVSPNSPSIPPNATLRFVVDLMTVN